jgi:ketosteroid isomerase-like protein
MAPSESDRRAVAATLEEYERALEGRDLDRLARIWIMNPAERGEFERFLEGRTAIRVTVEPLELSVDGDRAWVRFQQSIAAAIRPLLERGDLAFWRALAARDAYGGWSLDRLP